MASTINASTTSTTGLVYTADGTGILQLQSDGTTGLTVGAGGNVTVNTNLFVSGAEVEPLVLGTAQATTSGTAIDFTGIPSWVKKITVVFNGVSISGTSHVLVQIGVSTTPTTTGYSSSTTYTLIASAGTGGITSTSGFPVYTASASYNICGHMVITNVSGNIWVSSGVISNITALAYIGQMAGQGSLSGTLGMIRVTTVNGTDTFDAGSVNIMYE